MPLIQPLLAAIDWIQIVIVILFLLGPLLTQLGGGDKKAKRQQRRALRRPPQGPPQVPPRPQAAAQPALQKEIDDFLRQAQGRQGGPPQQQRQPKQRQPKQRPRQPQRRRTQPQKPVVRSIAAEEDARRATQQALQKKKAQQQQQAQRPRESVAEHVESHIESQPISDHAKQLGSRMGQTDENIEEHLHDVFDHKLGQLGESTATTSDIREGTDSDVWDNIETRRARDEASVQLRTDEIARMVRDAKSMRQAIIIGEILKPPKALE